MTYQDAIAYLYTQLPMYQRVGSSAVKKNLHNIKALCRELGNPHKELNAIHIAGTNGKGTTSHILSALFQQEGKKTGLYTSPHYKDFRERIKINGKLISKKKVVDFVQHYQKHLSHIKASFFELTVALAFQNFKEEKVDIAIIETGLGGRLDSTNIILPRLSVITNISFDHMSMLGNTIKLIANEKAGIIKKNVPVVIGEFDKESDPVFRSVAKKRNSQVILATEIIQLSLLKSDSNFDRYKLQFLALNNELNLDTDIKGPFQEKNISTALTAYYVYHEINDDAIKIPLLKKAFANIKSQTNYLGRWHIKRKKPLTILDSGHNEAGIKYIIEQLSKYPPSQLHIILGFVKDKNWHKLLDQFPNDARYYFCKADIPRALEAGVIIAYASKNGKSGRTYSSVRNAERAALRRAKSTDIIFIGGSTFVVAEAL